MCPPSRAHRVGFKGHDGQASGGVPTQRAPLSPLGTAIIAQACRIWVTVGPLQMAEAAKLLYMDDPPGAQVVPEAGLINDVTGQCRRRPQPSPRCLPRHASRACS